MDNIKNSVINVGSTIHGNVTNTTYNYTTEQITNVISEIDKVIDNNNDTFNHREVEQLRTAREQLQTGNVELAKSTLAYFKCAIKDIAHMTLTGVLTGFIVG